MTRKAEARHLLALGLASLCLISPLACGESEEGSPSAPPDYDQALAGAPKPLAELHGQANRLLEGGADAFKQRLTALRGYPVVVNKWASWCGPCRFEFPFFQRLSAKLGKRVAFLGVDSDDSEDAARTFLEEFPVPYPSYSDPDQDVAAQFKATLGFPSTAFYSSSGELVYTKQGGYGSQAELAADIRRYALSG
jgi:cytochrome c biogenesis protein CcmG, thiol:disulfide interchange protein DsbE